MAYVNITHLQVLRHITSPFNDIFLKEIELSPLVNTYICAVSMVGDTVKITLLQPDLSPFMGDIVLIMNLINSLTKYDMQNIPQKISRVINQFNYLISNHALKLMVNISDTIKNDPSKIELKESLQKNSVILMHKIAQIIKKEIDSNTLMYSSLKTDLARMENIKNELLTKINKIKSSIDNNNSQVQHLLMHDSDCHYSESGNDHMVVSYLSDMF